MTWIDEQERERPGRVALLLDNYREQRDKLRVSPYDNGDDRFGLWLALVDRRISRMVGIGLFDLADWNMHDAYTDGMSPRDAAVEALRSDDTFSALVEEAGL